MYVFFLFFFFLQIEFKAQIIPSSYVDKMLLDVLLFISANKNKIVD